MRTSFRSLMSLDRKFFGAYVRTSDPMIVEVMKYAGVDFIMYELEHDQSNYKDMVSIIRACDACGMAAMVRVPEVERVPILKALGMGASAIKCCDISTAEQARQLVAYCKYPPEGVRGACPFVRSLNYGALGKEHFAEANKEVVVSAVIESVEGLKNMDEIIATPGLDTVSIGLADLASTMGVSLDAPEVQQYVYKGIELCEKYGKQCSAQARSVEYLKKFRDAKCLTHYHIKAPEVMLMRAYRNFIAEVQS